MKKKGLQEEIYSIMEPLQCLNCSKVFPKQCKQCNWYDCYFEVCEVIKRIFGVPFKKKMSLASQKQPYPTRK